MKQVVDAAGSNDPVLQDLGTQALGDWPTPDAAEPLLMLAGRLEDEKLRTRAVRAYLRIAKQLDIPLASRVDICRNALKLSDRSDEANLVLGILRQYPSLDGLAVVASMLEMPKLREPVCSTIIAISQKLYSKSPDTVRPIVEKTLQTTKNKETIAVGEAMLSAETNAK